MHCIGILSKLACTCVRLSVHNLVTRSVVTKCCNNIVRVEKYRPGCLDDLISHKDITSTSK